MRTSGPAIAPPSAAEAAPLSRADASTTQDAMGEGDAHVDTVDNTSPEAGSDDGSTLVRGTVNLQLASPRSDADRVQLSLDGELIATLALPFQYTWDSNVAKEGAHTWTATLLAKGEVIATSTRKFVVDRTPPRFITADPAPRVPPSTPFPFPGLSGILVNLSKPFTLEFSEPMSLDSVRASLTIPGVMFDVTANANPNKVTIHITDAPRDATNSKIALDTTAVDRVGLPIDKGLDTELIVPTWVAADFPPNPFGSGGVSSSVSDGTNVWVTNFTNVNSQTLPRQLSRLSNGSWEPAVTIDPGTSSFLWAAAGGRMAYTT